MTDCYKTTKEALKEAQQKASKYNYLKTEMNKDLKRYKTLEQTTKNEDYKLAYSMLADYIEDKLEEIK